MAAKGTESHDHFDGSMFECFICKAYMLDRRPRTLNCLHTFCEECLEKILDGHKITCPSCQDVTKLKSNNIRLLRENFILRKMKALKVRNEFRSRSSSMNETMATCQVCMDKSSAYTCKQCARFMCTTCKEAHTMTFKGHILMSLCNKHKEAISHICMKCIHPLCMKCAILDHKEHEGFFLDYKKGIQKLYEEAKVLSDSLKKEALSIDSHLDQIPINKIKLKEVKESIVTEAEKLKELTAKTENQFDEIREAFSTRKEKCNSRAETLQNLQNNNEDFFSKFGYVKQKIETLLADKSKTYFRYEQQEMVTASLSNHIRNNMAVENLQKQILIPVQNMTNLRMVKEVVNIPKNHDITCTEEITFVGSDVALVTYKPARHVIRLNPEGEVVARYYPKVKGEVVNGVTFHDNKIYIVQSSAITVISQNMAEGTAVYKPKINNMFKICVKDDETIFITDYVYSSPSSLYKYNTKQDSTELLVKGPKDPSYISLVQSINGPQYIVTDRKAHSIKVYDSNWEMVHSFGSHGDKDGQFNEPQATAVTPMGTLLIVDQFNHRISHYTLSGDFLSHVLTKDDGIKEPLGVAYRHPYIWVCSCSHYVKSFQVEYSDTQDVKL